MHTRSVNRPPVIDQITPISIPNPSPVSPTASIIPSIPTRTKATRIIILVIAPVAPNRRKRPLYLWCERKHPSFRSIMTRNSSPLLCNATITKIVTTFHLLFSISSHYLIRDRFPTIPISVRLANYAKEPATLRANSPMYQNRSENAIRSAER